LRVAPTRETQPATPLPGGVSVKCDNFTREKVWGE